MEYDHYYYWRVRGKCIFLCTDSPDMSSLIGVVDGYRRLPSEVSYFEDCVDAQDFFEQFEPVKAHDILDLLFSRYDGETCLW